MLTTKFGKICGKKRLFLLKISFIFVKIFTVLLNYMFSASTLIKRI